MNDDTYGPGTRIDDAAATALNTARAQGQFKGRFNGTPLVAYPHDTVRHVVERWNYERLLMQLGYKGQ